MSRGGTIPASVAPVSPRAEYLKNSLRFRSFGFIEGSRPPFFGWIFFPADEFGIETAHRQTTISPAADRCQEHQDRPEGLPLPDERRLDPVLAPFLIHLDLELVMAHRFTGIKLERLLIIP